MKKALQEKWSRLSNGERIGLMALFFVASVTIVYRAIYFPQAQQLQDIRKQSAALQKDILAYNTELQQLEKQSKETAIKRDSLDLIRSEVERLEADMITSRELGDLLGELSKSGDGLEMKFETIKQNLKSSNDDPKNTDTEVSIDVVVHSPYEDLVNYLRRIERLSSFLRITRFEVFEPAEPQGPIATTKLTLLTPLRQSYTEGALSSAKIKPLPDKVEVKESLFFTAKPKKLIEKKFANIAVTGITVQGANSTAIVNGEVMRVGDQLGKLQIKDITHGGVRISDGIDEHVLQMSWGQ